MTLLVNNLIMQIKVVNIYTNLIMLDFLSNIVQQVITVTLHNMTATVGLPNYGLAIIIMTIIVKILLYPLTKKQIESTKAMMANQT